MGIYLGKSYFRDMDSKEEARLCKMMDEVSSGETETDDEPFSSDDDIRDPNYSASSDTSSAENETEGPVPDLSMEDREEIETPAQSPDISDDEWCEDTIDVPDFHFNAATAGITVDGNGLQTATEFFSLLWSNEIMDMLLKSMNKYAQILERT